MMAECRHRMQNSGTLSPSCLHHQHRAGWLQHEDLPPVNSFKIKPETGAKYKHGGWQVCPVAQGKVADPTNIQSNHSSCASPCRAHTRQEEWTEIGSHQQLAEHRNCRSCTNESTRLQWSNAVPWQCDQQLGQSQPVLVGSWSRERTCWSIKSRCKKLQNQTSIDQCDRY